MLLLSSKYGKHELVTGHWSQSEIVSGERNMKYDVHIKNNLLFFQLVLPITSPKSSQFKLHIQKQNCLGHCGIGRSKLKLQPSKQKTSIPE